MDEIPMPELLDPDRLLMPERDDLTLEEHRSRADAARQALRETCAYGRQLRDQLVLTREYLHGHTPAPDASDAEWAAWSARYAAVTSVLAGAHGDNGFGAEEAAVVEQFGREGTTPPVRPE